MALPVFLVTEEVMEILGLGVIGLMVTAGVEAVGTGATATASGAGVGASAAAGDGDLRMKTAQVAMTSTMAMPQKVSMRVFAFRKPTASSLLKLTGSGFI